MKNLSLFLIGICLFFAHASINAQTEFQPFRVDMGFGWNKAFWSNTGSGVALYFEPKYAVTPVLNIGVKFEGDLNSRNYTQTWGLRQWIGSCLATADYHFMQNSDLRLFAGAGLGVYHISVYNDAIPISGVANNFGAMLRVGFDVNHFRLALAYNYAGKDVADCNTSFFSITIGGYLGGGKKKMTATSLSATL